MRKNEAENKREINKKDTHISWNVLISFWLLQFIGALPLNLMISRSHFISRYLVKGRGKWRPLSLPVDKVDTEQRHSVVCKRSNTPRFLTLTVHLNTLPSKKTFFYCRLYKQIGRRSVSTKRLVPNCLSLLWHS